MPKKSNKPEEQTPLQWFFEMLGLYSIKSRDREGLSTQREQERYEANIEFNRKLNQKFGPYAATLFGLVMFIGFILFVFVKGCVTGS